LFVYFDYDENELKLEQENAHNACVNEIQTSCIVMRKESEYEENAHQTPITMRSKIMDICKILQKKQDHETENVARAQNACVPHKVAWSLHYPGRMTAQYDDQSRPVSTRMMDLLK